jgi:hypothetical protein
MSGLETTPHCRTFRLRADSEEPKGFRLLAREETTGTASHGGPGKPQAWDKRGFDARTVLAVGPGMFDRKTEA